MKKLQPPRRVSRCYVCGESLSVGVMHLYCPGCMRWICTHKPSLACPVHGGIPNLHPVPVRSKGEFVDVDWRDNPPRELKPTLAEQQAVAPVPPKEKDWWE